jgi:thiol-disulfide isomerase/thioredoxin
MKRRVPGLMLLTALVAVLLVPPAAAQGLSGLNQTPTLGATFPSFDAQEISGSSRKISYPNGSVTILLFFSSSCPVCHRMIPEWNKAFEKRSKGVEFVGVLMDKEPPGFFTAMPVAFPVVRLPSNDFARSNNVNRVPLTLRLLPGGKIEDLGLGVLDPIRLGELLRP